jgi:hypothetical protein
MEAADSSEMEAFNYQTTQCHNPEDYDMNLHPHENFESYINSSWDYTVHKASSLYD